MQDNTFVQAKPLVERSTPKRERLSILTTSYAHGIVEPSVSLRLHTFFAACYIAGLLEWGENIEHTC
jgi:hypothetical protein